MVTARWGEKKELLKTKCLFMGLVRLLLLARDGGRHYHMGHNLDCKPCLGRSRARLHLVEKNVFLTLKHLPAFECLKQLWQCTYLQKCMHFCMPPSIKAHTGFCVLYQLTRGRCTDVCWKANLTGCRYVQLEWQLWLLRKSARATPWEFILWVLGCSCRWLSPNTWPNGSIAKCVILGRTKQPVRLLIVFSG